MNLSRIAAKISYKIAEENISKIEIPSYPKCVEFFDYNDEGKALKAVLRTVLSQKSVDSVDINLDILKEFVNSN